MSLVFFGFSKAFVHSQFNMRTNPDVAEVGSVLGLPDMKESGNPPESPRGQRKEQRTS